MAAAWKLMVRGPLKINGLTVIQNSFVQSRGPPNLLAAFMTQGIDNVKYTQCCGISTRTSIGRTRRKYYVKQYKTLLVHPDGSTIRINYPEPRKIIVLSEKDEKLLDVDEKADIDLQKSLMPVTTKPRPKVVTIGRTKTSGQQKLSDRMKYKKKKNS